MARKGMGLLLAGGAALVLMSGGKKKKKKKTTNGTGDGGYSPDDDGSIYDDGGELDGPYADDGGETKVPPPKQDPSRPSGKPPGGDSFDAAYWGATLEEQLANIRDHFRKLGYSNVQEGPYPMNILGPKGSTQVQNIDGSTGAVGGGDDQKDATVAMFQSDYNKVSRLNKAEKVYQQNMGGLAVDGFIGPQTLNALRYAKTGLPGGKSWKPDLIQQAALKGIS